MDIVVSPEQVDFQNCGVLVCGFFEDERPLRGSSGWVDWRLNGRLSHLIKGRRLTGQWGEVTLIPSQGRLMSKMILLFGLGKVKGYSYLRVRERIPYFLKQIKKLSIPQICFSLPYHEEYNVDCGKLVEVILEGMADCLELEPFDTDQDWIRNLKLFFGEGEDHFSEILLGIQTAKSILKDRIQIRIYVPTEASVQPGP